MTRARATLDGTLGLHAGIPVHAGELRRLGCRTAAVYANPNSGRPFGFADGFDDFIETPLGTARRIRCDDLPESVRTAMDNLGYGDSAKAQ